MWTKKTMANRLRVSCSVVLLSVVLGVISCSTSVYAADNNWGDESGKWNLTVHTPGVFDSLYDKIGSSLFSSWSLFTKKLKDASGGGFESKDQSEPENGVKTDEVMLSGAYGFTPRFAVTYEWAFFKNIVYGSLIDAVPGSTEDLADVGGSAAFGLGFVAMVKLEDFGADEDSLSGSDLEGFGRRWHRMQPFSRPTDELIASETIGLHKLREVQPIYDLKTDDFDLWSGSESEWIFTAGEVLYFKPGVGFDRENSGRRFMLEVGVRYLF